MSIVSLPLAHVFCCGLSPIYTVSCLAYCQLFVIQMFLHAIISGMLASSFSRSSCLSWPPTLLLSQCARFLLLVICLKILNFWCEHSVSQLVSFMISSVLFPYVGFFHDISDTLYVFCFFQDIFITSFVISFKTSYPFLIFI